MSRLRLVKGGPKSRPFRRRLKFVGPWIATIKSTAKPRSVYTVVVNKDNLAVSCNCRWVLLGSKANPNNCLRTDCKHCKTMMKTLARKIRAGLVDVSECSWRRVA